MKVGFQADLYLIYKMEFHQIGKTVVGSFVLLSVLGFTYLISNAYEEGQQRWMLHQQQVNSGLKPDYKKHTPVIPENSPEYVSPQ